VEARDVSADGVTTSGLKIKNRAYSQMTDGTNSSRDVSCTYQEVNLLHNPHIPIRDLNAVRVVNLLHRSADRDCHRTSSVRGERMRRAERVPAKNSIGSSRHLSKGVDWRRQQLPVAAEDHALVRVDLTELRPRSCRRAAAGCVQTEKQQRRQGGMRSGAATTGRRG
jgi:hypothetical protein